MSQKPKDKPISFPTCTSATNTATHAIVAGELYELKPALILTSEELEPTKDGRKRVLWLGEVFTERK